MAEQLPSGRWAATFVTSSGARSKICSTEEEALEFEEHG